MMKKGLLLLIVLFAGIIFLHGEENARTGGRVRVHGNIAPSAGITTCNGNPAFVAGVKWSALVNHSLLLGCSFYGVPFPAETASGPLRIIYAGPVIGWVFFPDKIVHFSIECMAGTGGAWYRDNASGNTPFLFLLPGISVELNVSSRFHIALAGGYRLPLNAPDARGIAGELQFKFGDY